MELNGASAEPVRSHDFVSWTVFLKEQTPISLFDELYNEPKDKIARRPTVLVDIFEMAMKEEEYKLGGIGKECLHISELIVSFADDDSSVQQTRTLSLLGHPVQMYGSRSKSLPRVQSENCPSV